MTIRVVSPAPQGRPFPPSVSFARIRHADDRPFRVRHLRPDEPGLFPKSIKLPGGSLSRGCFPTLRSGNARLSPPPIPPTTPGGDPHETTFNMADNRRDELALPWCFRSAAGL